MNTGISRFASYHHLSWHAVGTKDLFLEWELFPMPCRRIRDKVSGYANVEGVCVNGALRDAYCLFRPAVGQMICLFMGEGCAPKAERVQLHFQNGKNLRLGKTGNGFVFLRFEILLIKQWGCRQDCSCLRPLFVFLPSQFFIKYFHVRILYDIVLA